MPELYMPFTVRVNPHLSDAREQTRLWCRQVGITDSLRHLAMWTEELIVGDDYPYCAAMSHPEGSPEGLFLTSNWFVWATYFDDFFPVHFNHTRDLTGARLFMARLSEFMPLDGGTTPGAANPVERGLDDLWRRAVDTLPEGARLRARRYVQRMLDSWLWELHNHVQNRVPDPVDYIEMRRDTFGSELGLSLSEPADTGGIPREVFSSRPIRSLVTSVADATGLLNDMVSYWKEIEVEGELNNGVLVVQRFLGCDLQQAACVVNDLRTARLRQFEHVKATDLPAVMDHFELPPQARQALAGFVQNLENWCAGVIQWHLECPRYHDRARHPSQRARTLLAGPTGLGTSAAHLGARLRSSALAATRRAHAPALDGRRSP